MSRFTVCGLFYGDHAKLARRSLSSLDRVLSADSPVSDFRFALNAASQETCDYVWRWLDDAATRYGITGRTLVSAENRFKYPMMRHLFRQPDRPLAPYVMWFDDDTWWSATSPDWWDSVLSAMSGVEMIGQPWFFPYPASRRKYFATQAWFDPTKPDRRDRHGRAVTKFFQGAWWVVSRSLIERFDWPSPDLRHNGGDSMLGELLYHQNVPVGEFHAGVMINADDTGRKSSAKRRGYSERPLGFGPVPVVERERHAFTLVSRDFPVSLHLGVSHGSEIGKQEPTADS